MTQNPGRLSKRWTFLRFALRPSPAEVRGMVADLLSAFGERGACNLLGVPVRTFRRWAVGLGLSNSAIIRCVWFGHAVALHPERLASLHDVITWGRFRIERRVVERPAAEWSDWSI